MRFYRWGIRTLFMQQYGRAKEAEMFRDRIKANYNALSPSFHRLADFILNQPLDVALMTATELAQQMDMDAATVVRFAQTIGYTGFREMIKEIQQVIKEELSASYSASLDTPDDAALFGGLLENEKHNLALAQARLTEQANTVLPALLDAERIWVLGQGHCAHLAAICAASLREIDLPAISFVPDPLATAKNLKGVGPTDVTIGFALTGMDLEVADAIGFARQRGAKTFAFSSSPVTAAARAAETAIVCPGPTQTHTPSFTGLAAMIFVLVAAFAARYPERAAAAKADLHESYRELLERQAHTASEVDFESLRRQF
jgi:DNA-binding MurR/RpiR family transcriptional regulator